MVREGDGWKKWTKPWPQAIDAWSHYLHGPSNNAVSLDEKVGPPKSMQWSCGPHYARSHEINSSMAAMVSAGGRLFYIWDEGPLGLTQPEFPEKWSLIARDAFSGTTLWKRPMPNWGWRQWHDRSRWDNPRERARMLRHLPATTPRRLVATRDRIFVTLGYEAPVSMLDATTGKVIEKFEPTALTDEILYDDGLLILRVRTPEHRPDKDVWGSLAARQSGRIMVVEPEKGKVLWESEPEQMAPLTLASRANRIYYSNYDQVICLDRRTGREIWRTEKLSGRSGHRGTAGTLVAHDEVVLYATATGSHSGELHVFEAVTGELRWEGPRYAGPGITNPPDLFVTGNIVWVGETRLPVDNMNTTLFRQGFDLLTGEVRKEINVPQLISPGHHYRCYRSKATNRYLMLPKRGIEFVDLKGENHMRHDWLRAPCIYGILPSNGMVYVAPHQCVCYQGVLMSDFKALTAEANVDQPAKSPRRRLTRGPARQKKPYETISEVDWPMYRHDPHRSGMIAMDIAGELSRKWEADFDGEITPPIVAHGRLLVAEKDTHTVHALDTDGGRKLWSFTTGGRIDSPPTVYQGTILFGCTDGYVYCLRSNDGSLIWRFQAAPRDRRIVSFEQIESTWPVHGSVLVQEDVTATPPRPLVYFTAGRSTFLDGGIFVYALDPATGEVVHQRCLDGPWPDPFEDRGGAGYMDGAKTDLLVSDGVDLYLHQERFRGDLERFPATMESLGKEGGGYRRYQKHEERGSSGKRLIATRGFLDDSYNEGTYWTYDDRWPGWDRHMNRVPAYGQILSFDTATLYGVHVFTQSVRVRRGFFPGTKGYRLFAWNLDSEKDRWSKYIPLRVRAMVATSGKLFVAGPPDAMPKGDPLAAFEGRLGAEIWAFSKETGEKVAVIASIDALPVYDGLIAAEKHLFLSTVDGRVICFGK
jgi:outer membrane protein assembly factor BamB